MFERYRPDVVLHTAAHKHVPVLEDHPVEAARTNVFGTLNVIEASAAVGVSRFVLISSDKAVRPSSVMGASKRVAEQVLLSRSPQDGAYCAVRFGNVLGSRGSVIPTFARQIESGGPVTVTDPRMTRFFMSVEEAVQLVLQASLLSEGRDIFMLEMGEPVPIIDLARRMIQLSGARIDVDIPIEVIGIRPGEKLEEDLRESDEDRLGDRAPVHLPADPHHRAAGVVRFVSRPARRRHASWRRGRGAPTPLRHRRCRPRDGESSGPGSLGRRQRRSASNGTFNRVPPARICRIQPRTGEHLVGPAKADRLVVVGQGYAGLPVAMRAVEVGFDVVGFDVDVARIKRLAAGESHVEDVASDVVSRALATGRYEPTDDPGRTRGFDVAVIDVPTPLTDGAPNLSHVTDAAAMLAASLRAGATVILESTTYPGTTEDLVAGILEEGSGLVAGRDFHLGYSPERIDPGNVNWHFANTPKVVSGIDTRLPAGRPGVLRPTRRPHRARVGHPRGRADQAVGEHVPARQHRTGQRVGHVRRSNGHRRLGGHRRGFDQAVRLPPLHARPWGGRTLPAHRSQLSVVEGAPEPRPAVPVRRAGQRRQRSTCPTMW